ncbi:MAG: nitroreductase family protein [Candidatus Obscuribacterales bacterium]|nr:nitroreductase family protein [Candidatus Obscuribacterales bacterium]
MNKYHTSPLLFLRPQGRSTLEGKALTRKLSLRDVELLSFFMEAREIEAAIESSFKQEEIDELLKIGLLVPCDDAGFGRGSTWEIYNLQRAAFLMFGSRSQEISAASSGATSPSAVSNSVSALTHESNESFSSSAKVARTATIVPTAPVLDLGSRSAEFLGAFDSLIQRRTERFFTDDAVSKTQIQNVLSELSLWLQNKNWISAYFLVQAVEGLEPGIYSLDRNTAALKNELPHYTRKELLECLHGQWWLNGGGFCCFFVVFHEDLRQSKLKPASYFDMLIDVGAAGQALVTAAYKNGLGTWMTPALSESLAAKILGLDQNKQEALYFFKVGIPQKPTGERRTPI